MAVIYQNLAAEDTKMSMTQFLLSEPITNLVGTRNIKRKNRLDKVPLEMGTLFCMPFIIVKLLKNRNELICNSKVNFL